MSTPQPVNLPLVRQVVKDFVVRPIMQRLQRKRVPFGQRNWRRLFESDCEKAVASRVLLDLKVERSPEVVDEDGTVTTPADVVQVGRMTQDWLQSLSPKERMAVYSVAVRDLIHAPFDASNTIPTEVDPNDTTGRDAPTLMGR